MIFTIELQFAYMNYFIYNPISGNHSAKKKKKLLELIALYPDNIVFETTQQGDEIALTKKAIELGAERVIAVGGDGTINKVGSVLVGTDIPLGIIPIGSGNGLARHLNISMQLSKALSTVMKGSYISMDACYLNDQVFFCTAGLGFDALVANTFDKRKKRGLFNYIIAVFVSLFHFKPIQVRINDGPFEELLLLTISNANQYGNNAYISPNADVQDGRFEIIKIKPLHPIKLITIVLRLFLKNIDNSSHVEIINTDHATIQFGVNQFLHADGESLVTKNEMLSVSVRVNSLKVIV